MVHRKLVLKYFVGFYWEGAPPTDIADLTYHSYPNNLLRLIHMRITRDIAEADK